MSDRCEHGNLWHEPCTLCAEEKQPTSSEERLLAGSLAIAELAALRKTAKEYGEWLESRSDFWFSHSKAEFLRLDEIKGACARSRGAAYHEAAEKLKSLLGDAQ